MNFESTQNAITGRFATNVATPLSIAVQYDNDGAFVKPNDADYIKLSVNFLQSFQVTLGANRRWRTLGNMVAEIFTLAGKGQARALQIADKIVAEFRGVKIGNLTFRSPYPDVIGRDDRFWHVNCYINFDVDDCD